MVFVGWATAASQCEADADGVVPGLANADVVPSERGPYGYHNG